MRMVNYLVPAILYDLCEDGVPGKDVIKHWFESEPGPEETL